MYLNDIISFIVEATFPFVDTYPSQPRSARDAPPLNSHMKIYNFRSSESTPLLPHPRMNTIRSSEVMQGSEDLFASQDSFLNMPTLVSSTNEPAVESHVFPNFPPPPALTRSSNSHWAEAERAYQMLMFNMGFAPVPFEDTCARDPLTTTRKRLATPNFVEKRRLDVEVEIEDDRLLELKRLQYPLGASPLWLLFLAVFVPVVCFHFFPIEFSLLWTVSIYTPYVLLCRVPYSATLLSPLTYIYRLMDRDFVSNFSVVYPIYYDFYSRVPTPGANGVSLWWTGVCAPLVEEVIKHYIPLGFMMPFLEFSMYVSQGANPYLRLAPLLMHCIGLTMPPALSLALHMWWNFSSFSLVTDGKYPPLEQLQSWIWSPFPMAFSHTLGSFLPGDQYQWISASLLSNAAICRLLGSERIKERSKCPGAPDPEIWNQYKFNGRFSNPGLSRGRLRPVESECKKGPRGGGHSDRWEIRKESFKDSELSWAPGYLPELESTRVLVEDDPVYEPPVLNRSAKRQRNPRRNFSGGGPLDEPISVSERRVAKHKVRTLLSSEEKRSLRELRVLQRCPRRFEHRDKALLDKLLSSKYAGEILASAYPPKEIYPEGVASAAQALIDFPTPHYSFLNILYNSIIQAFPDLHILFHRVPYSVFIALVNLLHSRDTATAIIALELLYVAIHTTSWSDQLKIDLIKCIKVASIAVAIHGVVGNFKSNPGEVEPEGFTEFASSFNRFASSPLVIKLMAVVFAFLPTLSKLEESIFGSAALASALEWLGGLKTTIMLTPFGLLADFGMFVMSRFELFARTQNWSDLFGSTPQIEWLDEADRLMKDIDKARSRPGECIPRVVCSKAKAHVAKSMKFKESLVSSKAKQLAAESDKLEKALLSERKPPLGFIMTGPPGIGKTSLVNLVAKIYKQSRGIDEDINVVYSWSDDKYQSPNAVSCIISINDAFQIKDEYAETGLDVYQSLVDSFALQVSGAAVDEKNVTLLPDLVFVSTNESVYTFSRSSGGANKLDRRYVIIQFSWSENCLALAKTEGLPCSTIFQKYRNRKDLVVYHMGYMDNTDGKNVMKMDIRRELDPPLRTSNIADIMIRIVEMEKNRPDLLAPSDILDFGTVCTHQYPPNGVCGCWDGNVLKYSDPEEDEVVVEGEIPVDLSYWIMAAASLFAMISILLTGKPPALTVQHRMVIPEKAALAIAVPAIVGSIYILVQWLRTQTAEGLIHSTPSVPPPPEDEVVRVNRTTHAPYIGSTPASYMARIEGSMFCMNAIVLNPDLLAVPKHFFLYQGKKLSQDEVVTITYKGKKSFWRVDWPCVWLDPNQDLAIFTVGNLDGVAGTAYKLLPETDSVPDTPCSLGSNRGVRVSPRMEYIAETMPGDCGLPLVDETGTCIFGFHVGRRTNIMGSVIKVGVPLSKATVRRALAQFREQGLRVHIFSDELPIAFGAQGITAEGVYPHGDAGWYQRKTPLAHVDHIPVGHKTIFNKPKFTATKTTLFEEFGAECKPYGKPHAGHAIKQEDGSWSSAETIRLDACDHATFHVDHSVMTKAVDAYVDSLPITEKDKCTPLSDYTAWCGSDLNVLINGVDVEKSHGATAQILGFSKDELFKDLGDGQFEIHPVMLEMCNKFEEELRENGPLPMPYIRSVAKDEVYPVDKAAKGRRRYFFLQDRACNHVMRKYLQPILVFLLEHPIDSHIIGTVNAGSVQWKTIFKEITRFGRMVTDGDQSSMDTRHRLLMKYYCEVMVKVGRKLGYSPGDLWMVERILASLSRYCLEMEGDFFVCFSGLVSGRADTLVCNSVCLILIFYYSFFLLKPEFEIRPIREIVALLVTGDDSAMNAHDSIKSWYNGQSVAKVASGLGYVMTAGNKSDKIDWVDISSIQYLKRGFREDGDYVWAPLATDSIFKALSYATGVRDPALMRERDRAASHSAIREGFLHGKEFMDDLRSRLLKHFPDEQYPSYDELKTDYDSGVFEAWTATHVRRHPYVPNDSKDVVIEGSPTPFDVVYPRGNGASLKCPIKGRGAFQDFPVPTNFVEHRDIPAILYTFPSDINPTSNDVAKIQGSDANIHKFPDPTSLVYVTPNTYQREVNTPLESLENLLRTPRKIGTQAACVFGGNVLYYPIAELNSVSDALRRRLKPWSAIKADLGIRVKYTGSSALIGAQRITFGPAYLGGDLDTYNTNDINTRGVERIWDFVQTSTLPHMDLDISCTMDKTIILPYMGHTDLSHYADETVRDWWIIKSTNLVPVRSVNGTTPPTVYFEIWAWLENVTMDVLIPEGELPPGILSNSLSYASRIASLVSSYTSTFSVIAAKGASVAHSMGLSRATQPVGEVTLTRTRATGVYTSGEPDFSIVLGSSPFMLRDVSPLETTQYPSVTSLARSWCQGVNEATPNTSYYASPEWILSTYPTMRPTTLGFLSMMFESWGGDLEYKLQVFSSPLIRGRIGVNVYPPGATAAAFFKTDGSVIAYEFDVEGSTEFTFTVPFLTRQPLRTTTVNAPTHNFGSAFFKFFLLSDFVGPAATPVYPSVNIWVRAGEDFCFLIPNLSDAQTFTYTPEGLKESNILRSGEFVDNFKELATRKSPMFSIDQTSANLAADGVYPHSSWDALTTGTLYWTFDTFLRTAFWGYTGGTRYTIETDTSDPYYVGTGRMPPWSSTTPFLGTMSRGFILCAPATDCHDFVVPDRSYLPYKFTDVNLIGVGQNVESLVISNTTVDPGNLTVWSSAGEDRTYFFYNGPPLLRWPS